MTDERTFLAIKPDAVHRGLVGDVISRLEQKGFKLVAMKFMRAPRKLLHKHYAEHTRKPFFDDLVDYMSSGPVVAMVWQGEDIIASARTMIGATRPSQAAPGTIRGDYAMDGQRNIMHGSDSADSAKREIDLWFAHDELEDWDRDLDTWIYASRRKRRRSEY